ncbi:hypothetical protein [Sagittula sp. SSi028]|uniref:hypothetical protein n=1 Tax=Sagittula sp. SSi028 TaxID=3400636 RepID=UPI003AF8F29E
MKSCLAFVVIVSASAAAAGQISVVNPPNIVTPAPVIPVAPPVPTVSTPSVSAPSVSTPTVSAPSVVTPTVSTDVVLPGFGNFAPDAGTGGGLSGARRGTLPTAVMSFPVERMTIPQMQQALISISQLLASGRLRPAQAAVLQQQADRMVQALNAGG